MSTTSLGGSASAHSPSRRGGDALPPLRIERVAQAISEEIEAEHGHHDREPGEDREVRRELEVLTPFVEHHAPRRRRWLRRETEERERAFGEHGPREREADLH